MKSLSFFIALICVCAPFSLQAYDRFFVMGSGQIHFSQNGKSLQTLYRKNSVYDEDSLRKINALYGSNYNIPTSRMPLRFLEILSAVQNHFNDSKIYIKSGYRSPIANQKLRNKGKLAAQSSMHKEAAAADFYLEGISGETLKDYAQSLSCCGVGYYQGRHIHLDTGPLRWWDESNSGTEKKEPQENEKIIASTEFDFYKPNEKIVFDFARITNYPVAYDPGVMIEKKDGEKWVNISKPMLTQTILISKYEEQKNISLAEAPAKAGRYRLKILLDNKTWLKMPTEIFSNEFEVKND